MGHRLLLCDDEVHIVRIAQFKLVNAGFEVNCAYNGLDAWNFVQAAPPDLLLTDLQMPGMSGFELIERMRSYPPTKHIPVIMLTAKGYELRDLNLLDRFNNVEVISKPFSPRALLQLVSARLNVTLPVGAGQVEGARPDGAKCGAEAP